MTHQIQAPLGDARLDRLVREALMDRSDDVLARATSADAMAERMARRPRLIQVHHPARLGFQTALVLLAVVGLLAAAAVAFVIGSRAPNRASVEMTVIRQQVDAINVRDTDAFIGTFAPGAAFNPGGDFRGMVMSHVLPLAQVPLVKSWMAINDAWGFQAEIISCDRDAEPTFLYGNEGATAWS